MGRILMVTALVVLVAVAGAWALQAMGIVDFQQMLLGKLQTVPALADHVAIYRLGLTRKVDIAEMEAAIEKERALTEAERLALESERKALAEAWAEVERARAELDAERQQLAREWQGLYEAREVEENIARLVTVYEQMKPDQLASVAHGLDDTMLIQLLFQMDERRAASLLAALPSDRAAKLSRMIAGERG